MFFFFSIEQDLWRESHSFKLLERINSTVEMIGPYISWFVFLRNEAEIRIFEESWWRLENCVSFNTTVNPEIIDVSFIAFEELLNKDF